MIFLFFLFVLQTKSLKFESYENIDFDEIEKNPELKNEIFMNLVGAEKDECLPSVEETIYIMKKKYGKEIDKTQVTKNLRFIAGKCNPVILVPGMLSVRSRVRINCDDLFEKEKDVYKKFKFFCRFDNICPPFNFWDKYDEKEIFLNIFGQFGFSEPLSCTNEKDDPITLTCQNLYNACFSYFLNIFDGDECAKYDSGKSVCTKSDYIKILFDGGTEFSHIYSKCGTHAVKNILSNIDIKKSRVFGDVINLYKNIGYNFGFSLGAIPNDFRKFVATNKFATDSFRYLIESFYNNTGKKVILIAHSFGNLITLHNLIAKENQDLIPKIKKFVSIGPPFAGATKLLYAYLHDLKDFNNNFPLTRFYTFGQSLLFKSAPVLSELKPLPIFSKLKDDKQYSLFVKAIKERMELEKCLIYKNCSEKSNSREFDNLFDSYYPSLNSTICQDNNNLNNKFEKKCFLNIFNIFEKPMIIEVKDPEQIDVDNFDTDNYCNSNPDKCYYVNERHQRKRSIEDLFTKRKYVYKMKEMDEFYRIYNKNKWEYGLTNYSVDESDFETEEELRKANLLQFDHQKNISLIKDLPIPPVDTDLVYSSVTETKTGEFVRSVLEEGKSFSSGGDGTVSTWSSILVGLKWIYDKKNNNSSQKIRLVEYCSKLNNDFKYNETSNFIALGCNCLKDNKYSKLEECGHQEMLFDPNLLSYLKKISEIDDDITEDRKNAVEKVLTEPNIDYEMLCNKKLLDLVDPKVKSNFLGLNIIFIIIQIILVYF